MTASEKLTRFDESGFIQLADDKAADISYVHLVRNGEPVPSGTYVVTTDGQRHYFAQLATPNRNVNVGPDPYSSASLEASIRIAKGFYEKSALLSVLPIYEAVLLRMQDDGAPGVVSIRPQAGSGWNVADFETVERFLDLPTGGREMEIGVLRNVGDVRVPVVIDDFTMRHHILVAGSTGSGKTNTLANAIHAAASQGCCVFVFDLKPDYQSIHLPNSAAGDRACSFGDAVKYWTLGNNKKYGEVINVRASDVSPGMLAYAICYLSGEDNQAEVLEAIIEGYAASREGESWNFRELTDWIGDSNAAEIAKKLPFKMDINTRTYAALRSKMFRPARVPDWIRRCDERRSMFGTDIGTAAVDIDRMLIPGRVNVIHVPKDYGGRGYALFLSYLLKAISKNRAERPDTTPKVMHVVDEASDIFVADNRKLRDQATSVLSEEIRKGRSLGIGFVISLQHAGDCPDEIRHNLNTNIAFRHRHPKVLKEIFPAAIGLEEEAATLGRGEALMEQFGVPGVLRVKMHISPCELS